MAFWDFPGGSVVKNPPASAGDTGSIPGSGRSHMPAEQLSLCALEPTSLQLLKPTHPRAGALQQEMSPQ